jgi:hypothetical protein
MTVRITTQIESDLIERARVALDCGEGVRNTVIVRTALLKAIGDETMNPVLRTGPRPRSSHTD